MPNVAILDDYQGVALKMADWSGLPPDCQVQAFRDHLTDLDALVQRNVSAGTLLVPDIAAIPLGQIKTGVLTPVRVEKVEA